MLVIPLQINGAAIEVELCYNPRSKSMRLRLDRLQKRPIVTLPPQTPEFEVMAFLERSKNWLLKRLNQHPCPIPFINGNSIPIFGQDHIIHYSPAPKSKIELQGSRLVMQGPTDNLSQALKIWLKHHAHAYLSQRCQEYAKIVGKKINYVRVREVKSRWGSCSQAANLSFSWRLVFAPLPVVDYVCAHEVAHLVEMNHSRQFWAVVELMCPHPKVHIHWLKQNAPRLFSYG
ncbi:MAG: M48 family metallopeptidase [Alphaproteobacteria bacterium]|nr:M48 family metallopeptidase [Alphaproteobacteria bacterium]